MLGQVRGGVMPVEDFQAMAFASFVKWAAGEPGMVDAFNVATKRSFMVPQLPLEAAIDRASGYAERKTQEDAEAFLHWLAEEHWGLEHAPAKLREEILAKRRARA